MRGGDGQAQDKRALPGKKIPQLPTHETEGLEKRLERAADREHLFVAVRIG